MTKGLLKIFLLLALVAYWAWEIYWSTKVGLSFIKWHTHLMPFVTLGVFSVLFWDWFRRMNSSKKLENRFLLCGSVIFSLFVAESFLVITGIQKTYLERAEGAYMSPYASTENNYYHIWPAEKEHWLTKPEYSYWRPTNALGFGDHDWSVDKRPGTKRILALGDSFTEGDGAAYDSSYVSFLRMALRSGGDSCDVLNGGVCGSDPFYNYVNLKDRLLKYKPDIIIQTIHSDDMKNDILHRGGFERFRDDGTQKYRPAPWWEPVYALSYISRVFFAQAGYDQSLHKKELTLAEKNEIDDEVIDLLHRYDSLCTANHIKLVLILFPENGELEKNEYYYDFKPVCKALAKDRDLTMVDLIPMYKSYIEQSHSVVADYFWKKDGHHNAKGYQMMATGIYDNILPLLRDSVSVTRSE